VPTVSGKLAPLLRSETIPAMKSCAAPMKIPPKVIHRNATGPYAAPSTAPKIGPSPAILSSCMRKVLHIGIGI